MHHTQAQLAWVLPITHYANIYDLQGWLCCIYTLNQSSNNTEVTPHHTTLHCTIQQSTELHHITLQCTTQYHATLHMSCHAMTRHTIPHHTALYAQELDHQKVGGEENAFDQHTHHFYREDKDSNCFVHAKTRFILPYCQMQINDIQKIPHLITHTVYGETYK